MSQKGIVDPPISGNFDDSRILRCGTNVNTASLMLVVLGFVFVSIGIGVLPAAYAESPPPGCTGDTDFVPGGGGKVKWEKCINVHVVKVRVTTTDTVLDGKCAETMVDFRNGTPLRSHLVCDGAPPDTRDFDDQADDATIWIQLKN